MTDLTKPHDKLFERKNDEEVKKKLKRFKKKLTRKWQAEGDPRRITNDLSRYLHLTVSIFQK